MATESKKGQSIYKLFIDQNTTSAYGLKLPGDSINGPVPTRQVTGVKSATSKVSPQGTTQQSLTHISDGTQGAVAMRAADSEFDLNGGLFADGKYMDEKYVSERK